MSARVAFGFEGDRDLGLAVKRLVEVGRVVFEEALAADGVVGVVLVDASSTENSAVDISLVALVRD